MKELLLKNKKFPNDPLPINYYPARTKANRILILLGGSGNNRDQFDKIARALRRKIPGYDIIAYSTRGLEVGKEYPLKQLSADLEELVAYFSTQKRNIRITLVATSLGAYQSCFLSVSKKFGRLLDTIILLDPGDYHLYVTNNYKHYPWSGFDTYKPNRKTISMLLQDITSNVVIHVVNFTLRNMSSDGYAPSDERGQDNPKLFPRLNNDMVRSFYENTPKKNRGKYIEDDTIPHSFLRDGNLQANEKRVVQLIVECLANHQ